MSEKDFENVNENENNTIFTESSVEPKQITDDTELITPIPEAASQNPVEAAAPATDFSAQETGAYFTGSDSSQAQSNASQGGAQEQPFFVPAAGNGATEANFTGNGESYGGFSQKWNYEKSETKAKKKGKGLKIFAITMCVLFVATLSAFVTYYYTDKMIENTMVSKEVDKMLDESGGHSPSVGDKVTNSDITQAPLISGDYTGEELSSQEVIALAAPSVVGIKTMVEQYYGYWYGTQTYEGVGSGFIITNDGYIVTNYHVVEDAVSIKVILSDNTEYDAEIIGYDELSDVAVLKIEAQGLPALVIGNSDALLAGDTVIAIGCPAGIDLAGTATRGMISMVNRELSMTDSYGRVQKVMSVIQTDAAINPGNSGGPLLNMRGEVIGINTLKLSSSSYEGIGFALPINGVMKLVDQICKNGAVVERPTDSFVTGKAALGITYQEVTAAMTKRYNLPQGVLVVLVSNGSAAQKSGIKSGDVIVEMNSKEITTDDELIELLDSKKPGDEVEVKLYRDGEYLELKVILTESAE